MSVSNFRHAWVNNQEGAHNEIDSFNITAQVIESEKVRNSFSHSIFARFETNSKHSFGGLPCFLQARNRTHVHVSL